MVAAPLAIGGAVAVTLWLATVVGLRLATRPRVPPPDPAGHGSRPAGSPALAALLTNVHLPRRALTATLLELAADGRVRLTPARGEVWIRVMPGPSSPPVALAGPSRVLLAHLEQAGAATDSADELGVPLSRCTIGHDAGLATWSTFTGAVESQARQLGLRRQRAPRWVRVALRLTAIAVWVPLALAVSVNRDIAAVIVSLAYAIGLGLVMGILAGPLRRHHHTAPGQRLAAEWQQTGPAAMDDLPAAYAVALGSPPPDPLVEAIGTTLEADDRTRVWSDLTGGWRPLTVHTRHEDGVMETRSHIVARAAAVLVTAPFLGVIIGGPTLLITVGTVPLGWFVIPVLVGLALAGGIAIYTDTWRLARDFLRPPVTVLGTVVYTEYIVGSGESSPSYCYVGIDDGSADDLPLWDVSPSIFRRLRRGSRVSLVRTPVRHGLRSLRVRPDPVVPGDR